MASFGRRRSLRLKDYDYSTPAFYFLTMCTHQRKHIFGSIERATINLTDCGRIVDSCWRSVRTAFDFIEPDAFVIMPNHFHAVLRLNEGNTTQLSVIVRKFKSASARKCNAVLGLSQNHIWQRNYYEHIIRKERELNLIRLYVDMNPALWSNGIEFREYDFRSEEELSRLLSRYRV